MKKLMVAVIALAMALISSVSNAAYTSVQWGIDRTVPTNAPVCIMTGPSCLIEIGRANTSTGGWAISPSAIPTPTAVTLGGVLATPPVTHQFVTGINTADGGLLLVQPVAGDLGDITADTYIGNAGSAPAAPAAVSRSNCNGATKALNYTAGVGESCNSAIAAATAPASGVTYTPPLLGGVPEAISTTLARTVFADQYGADPTGVADSTAAINSLIAAVPPGAIIKFDGDYKLTGEISLSNRDVTIDCNAWNGSGGKFIQYTTSAKIINNSNVNNKIVGCSFTYDGIPAAGAVAIYSSGSNLIAEKFFVLKAYDGVYVTTGSGQFFSDFQIFNYEHIGFYATSVNDIFLRSFIINAGTGAGSLGGIRLMNRVEAFIAEQGDILGGTYSLTTDAATYSQGTRPAYNRFTNVYFDSSSQGSLISNTVETEFIGAWFSGGRSGGGYHGLNIGQSDTVKFTGTQFFNNGCNGAYISSANAKRIQFIGSSFESNSATSGIGVCHGLSVAAGVSDFSIIGGNAGNGLYTGQQGYGVLINGGASNNYNIIGLACNGNTIAGISDGGTGTNKAVLSPGCGVGYKIGGSALSLTSAPIFTTLTGYLRGNGASALTAVTASGILDDIGSTRGSILYRGASAWSALTPGTSGQVLQSGGAGADPSWATLGTASPPPQGRITLTSATPVLTTTVSGATTVYYTPYIGNQVPIWNGSAFAVTTFAEVSQATTDATKSPAAATTNSNYDLFVWSDSGTVRCTRGPPWTSDTARGTGAGTTELTRVNGIWTNTVAITNGPAAGYGTYVGTIRTNGSSQVDYIFGGSGAGGVASSLGVWNMYNRVSTTTEIQDSTATWPYTTGAWRNADNSATMRHQFLIGMSEDALSAEYADPALSTGGTAAIGVALDGSSPSAKNASFNGTTVYTSMVAFYSSMAPLGWHYLQAVEYGSAGGTFVGTATVGGGNFIMTLRN